MDLLFFRYHDGVQGAGRSCSQGLTGKSESPRTRCSLKGIDAGESSTRCYLLRPLLHNRPIRSFCGCDEILKQTDVMCHLTCASDKRLAVHMSEVDVVELVKEKRKTTSFQPTSKRVSILPMVICKNKAT